MHPTKISSKIAGNITWVINSTFCSHGQVATDKVAGKLSSTLSWVKNSVSQMASTVAPPTTLQTTPSTSLSSPGLSPTSSNQLSPDDVELLAKLEEQNRWAAVASSLRDCPLSLPRRLLGSRCVAPSLSQWWRWPNWEASSGLWWLDPDQRG